MREIKFRAWHKGLKTMDAYPIIATHNDGKFFTLDVVGDGQYDSGYSVEIMQYTGLKDKNGKEIYEGDIIKIEANKRHPEYIGKVIWNQDSCGFETEIGNDWMPIEKTNKIIGNIYENPELLK